MYRLLEIGETIMDGDQFYDIGKLMWKKMPPNGMGETVMVHDALLRRKITKTETNTGNYTVNNYNRITVMGRIGNGDKKKVKKSKWTLCSEKQPEKSGCYLCIRKDSSKQEIYYYDNDRSTWCLVIDNVIKWRKLPKVD